MPAEREKEDKSVSDNRVMLDQPDLFDVGERTEAKPRGPCVPDRIGSGPSGETCGSCRWKNRTGVAGRYLKCALMRQHWTGGPGSDIRAKWAACSHWQGRQVGGET